jgi:hypothetical protein
MRLRPAGFVSRRPILLDGFGLRRGLLLASGFGPTLALGFRDCLSCFRAQSAALRCRGACGCRAAGEKGARLAQSCDLFIEGVQDVFVQVGSFGGRGRHRARITGLDTWPNLVLHPVFIRSLSAQGIVVVTCLLCLRNGYPGIARRSNVRLGRFPWPQNPCRPSRAKKQRWC